MQIVIKRAGLCLATNPRLLGIILASCALAQPQQWLDLTRIENQPSPGLTGDKASSAVKRVELPIAITLERVWPLSITWRDKVEVDVTIRNIGQETIAIPASKNYGQVYKAGNANVKSMSIALRMTPIDTVPEATPVVDYIDFAVSSTSLPESFVLLAPNSSLSIRVAGQLPEAGKAWRDSLYIVRVRAQVVYSELYIDATDLKTWNSSTRAVSANSIEFTLALPRRR